MMDHLIKVAIVLCAAPFLLACKDKQSYSYLTQHPIALKEAFDHCQEMETRTPEDNTQCEVVMKAAAALTVVIDSMQSDPQKFGQSIMAEQLNAAKLNDERMNAERTVADLKAKNAPAADIAAAQTKLTSLQEQYDKKQEDLKVMLAVVGMNSPE